ncbi:MAG TPA: hypothetical protein VIV13_01130 [Solirubrobacterales bacterium]
MILTQQAISLIYQFWIHTERVKKMPAWFEFFFNTPSHHRVHHGSARRLGASAAAISSAAPAGRRTGAAAARGGECRLMRPYGHISRHA